ncbi:MAG: hypothetical protein GY928_31595 [Colwellia sp.]|nr:hypothetical protein [Colwellia sp.]
MTSKRSLDSLGTLPLKIGRIERYGRIEFTRESYLCYRVGTVGFPTFHLALAFSLCLFAGFFEMRKTQKITSFTHGPHRKEETNGKEEEKTMAIDVCNLYGII